MSPEQIVGDSVDERTDIFALGSVLYEIFTGRRAFRGPTRADTLAAILKDEPADPLEVNPSLPPAVAVVVRRCLEKNKQERFQSAMDLAFHLQQLEPSVVVRPAAPTAPFGLASKLLVAALVLATVLGMARLTGLLPANAGQPVSFERISFRRGRIGGARLTPEGVIYSQAVAGKALEVSFTRTGSSESMHLEDFDGADILAARNLKIGLSLNRRFAGGERFVGTFAEAEMGTGARAVADDVEDADWDGSGGRIALVVSKGRGTLCTLEYRTPEFPRGRKLYESAGSIQFPRVTRDGRRVAFLEDPNGTGSRGRIVVIDENGARKTLTPEWNNARGLAWSPGEDEIWYAASDGHANRAIRAVDLSGKKHRVVLEAPGALTIWDAMSDGRVLLTRDDNRKSLIGVPPGAASEQDLSWFDGTGLGRLSADGRRLVFGDRFGIYIRPMDGRGAINMGFEGAWVDDLSPDGQFILATSASGDQLMLVPTGAGESRVVPTSEIIPSDGARWFPDNRRILINGKDAHQTAVRSYVLDLEAGSPWPLTQPGSWGLSISPDGARIAGIGKRGVSLWRAAGPREQAGEPVPGSQPGDRPVAWTSDGTALWIFRRGELPAHVYRVEIATGRRELWKTIAPDDPAGVYSILDFDITPDGRSYFYSYWRVLSELYVVRGLR
jgi:Tol biopolymer transport system component